MHGTKHLTHIMVVFQFFENLEYNVTGLYQQINACACMHVSWYLSFFQACMFFHVWGSHVRVLLHACLCPLLFLKHEQETTEGLESTHKLDNSKIPTYIIK